MTVDEHKAAVARSLNDYIAKVARDINARARHKGETT